MKYLHSFKGHVTFSHRLPLLSLACWLLLTLLYSLPSHSQFNAEDALQINTNIPEVSNEEIFLQGQITNFTFDQKETLISLSTNNGLWQLNAPSSVELRRLGWKSDSLFIGEQVQVAALRQLGLGNKGTALRITRANGALLFASLNNHEQQAHFNQLKKGLYSLNRDYSQVHLWLDNQGYSQIGVQFQQVASEILWNADVPETSIVQINIDTASLSTGIPAMDTNLKEPGFFNPTNSPKIRFRSTSIEFQKWGDAQIKGQLEINKQVQPIQLNARIIKITTDPTTEQQQIGMRFKGDLRLTNWGLTPQSELFNSPSELVFNAVFVLRDPAR